MRTLIVLALSCVLLTTACAEPGTTAPRSAPTSTEPGAPAGFAKPPASEPPATTQPPVEAAAVALFLDEFLTNRILGTGAETQLSQNAAADYESPDTPLYEGFLAGEISDIEAVEDGSFVALLHLETRRGIRVEAVGIGPGPDLGGVTRPLVVLFAILERFDAMDGATAGSVAAGIQQQLDEEFASRGDPPPGVLGAMKVVCLETGRVGAGEVMACTGHPRTTPDFPLDPTGILVAVLDEEGTVAWSTGTDLPDRTERLREIYDSGPQDLTCSQLLDPQQPAGLFGGAGTTPENAYFLSVVYWMLEDRPARMDLDGDFIPCEEEHPAPVVVDIWKDGPVR